MKALLLSLSVIFTLCFFTSCETNECIECSFEVANLTQESGQQCGTKDEIEAVEIEWTQMAADSGGSEVTCVRSE